MDKIFSFFSEKVSSLKYFYIFGPTQENIKHLNTI